MGSESRRLSASQKVDIAEFWQWVARRRHLILGSRHVLQKDIAEALGYSVDYIAKLEQGRRWHALQLQDAQKLASVLGIEPLDPGYDDFLSVAQALQPFEILPEPHAFPIRARRV